MLIEIAQKQAIVVVFKDAGFFTELECFHMY
jgi:hypothetical protein